MHPFVCYCIKADNSHRTYVGVTNNLVRRIRQHNKEIKGGAKYTSSGGPWSLAMLVGPFLTYQHALHFEWHWKHCAPRRITNAFLRIWRAGIFFVRSLARYISIFESFELRLIIARMRRWIVLPCRGFRSFNFVQFRSDAVSSSRRARLKAHLHGNTLVNV